MEQLQTIFWERNSDISQLGQEQKQLRKQDFQQRQRVRVQRQNWIIKVIKTIKIITIQNKKSIFESVKRMMSYYKHSNTLPQILDYDKNFTQEFINLFINFYAEFGIGDTSLIKKIIRPNNAYIIIDLVKQLVETHRQYFKVKLLQTYRQAPKLVQQKSKTRIFPIIMSRRQLPTTQPSQAEQTKKQVNQQSIQVYDKIKQALLQKWQNYVNYDFPTEKNLKSRINDAYCELLQRNTNNKFIINKFQQKCFGKSRNISYVVAGLYTQQQVKNMENKLKHDVKQKFASIKQLRGAPSAEQLKQYFKIKTQIQDGYDKLQSKKPNNQKVNSWLPIITCRVISHENPISIYVLFGKDQIFIDQFMQRCGLNLRSYLKLVLKQKIDELNHIKQDNQLKNFKRHHFIDLNHAKKKQLMIDQHRVYSKDKKQSIFPLLRSNQLRQQKEIALKNRSLSQHKLSPIFKNQILNRKLQIQQQTEPNMQNLSEVQTMKNKQQSMSFLKQQQKHKLKWNDQKQKARSKIDNIISLIINQRNLTLTS